MKNTFNIYLITTTTEIFCFLLLGFCFAGEVTNYPASVELMRPEVALNGH